MLNRDKETACLMPIFGEARVKRDFTLLMLDHMYCLVNEAPPAALQVAFSREEYSPERLIKNLTAAGVTLQQDETLPYTVLLQELRKFGILTTDLIRSDHHQLLRALARAPENQLVIPVLFVLLYSEWYRRHNAQMDATKDSGGESQIRDICNRLSLELPDILYVFGLIRTRLDEELKRVSRLSGSIPVSTFRHILSNVQIVLSEEQFDSMLAFLNQPDIGIITAAADNENATTLHVSKLLSVCNALHLSREYNPKTEQRQKASKIHVSRLQNRLRRVWRSLYTTLQEDVTVNSLFDSAAELGLLLSSSDKSLLWGELLLQCIGKEIRPSIPLEKLHLYMQSDLSIAMEIDANAAVEGSLYGDLTTSSSSSTSSHAGDRCMRKSERRHITSNEGDHIAEMGYLRWQPQVNQHADPRPSRGKYSDRLFGSGQLGLPWENDSTGNANHAPSTASTVSPKNFDGVNHHPWMNAQVDESKEVSNEIQRLCTRLATMDISVFSTFVRTLKILSEQAGTDGLTRGAFMVALSTAGVRLDKKAATIMYSSCRDWIRSTSASKNIEPVTHTALLAWLDIQCHMGLINRALDAPDEDASLPVPPPPAPAPAPPVAGTGTPSRAQPPSSPPRNTPTRSVVHSSLDKSIASPFDVPESPSHRLRSSPLRNGVSTESAKSPFQDYVPDSLSADAAQKGADSNRVGVIGADGAKNKLRNSSSNIFGPTPPDSPPQKLSDTLASTKDTGSLSESICHNTTVGIGSTAVVLNELQEKRHSLALLFRRLFSHDTDNTMSNDAQGDKSDGKVSGAIRLCDFATELPNVVSTNTSEILRKDPDLPMKVCCDIINASYNCDPQNTYVHISDVLSFLDAVKAEARRGDRSSIILRQLKDKCHASTSLHGEKIRLLMLTPQLRQRLKRRFRSGKSLGFSVSGPAMQDHCGYQDLMEVFTTIDVHLTHEEAKYLCLQTCDDEGCSNLEVGTTLGSVIRYLCEYTLS